MRRRLFAVLAIAVLVAAPARAQTTVVVKAIDTATGATTDIGNGTDHAIRVTQASGGTAWTFNWTQLLGAAPSATNPMPSRLTDGSTYLDPRSIRSLTSSDVVTVVQGTGSNLHVVVDTAPTTAVTGTFWPATQPVSMPPAVVASGTFLTASGNAITLSGLTSMGTAYTRVSVSSALGPPSVNFDVSLNGGTTWVPLRGTLRTSAGAITPATATAILAITVTEVWFTLPSGATDVRVIDTGGSSGALVTVLLGAASVAAQPFPGVTQVGSWSMTATQSTAGSNANAWWMRIGDATNGPVAVKAASTAAAATDPALVVRSIQLPAALGAAATAASLPVNIANDQTVPVSGPATDTQLRASPLPVSFTNQSVNLNQVGGASFALGQQLAAASLPMVLTAAQLTTLTPPAAITGFALDATLTNRTAKTIITDGTNDATVKAASTLPAATDKAVVVTLRESLSTPVTGTFWQATQPVSGTFFQATQPVSGTVAATQSGTWTVQPGNTANTTAWKVDGSAVTQPVSGTVSITANSAVNLAQVAGVTTSTGLGVSNTGTQRVSLTQEATYAASTAAKTATASGTAAFLELCGSASTTVRVQRIMVSGTWGTAGTGDIQVRKNSSAGTGGTATTLTNVPYDSGSAAATAVAKYFTVLPTGGGALVGNIMSESAQFPLAAAAMTPQLIYVWRDTDAEAPTLRGTAQCLAVGFGTAPGSVPTLSVSVAWTEK